MFGGARKGQAEALVSAKRHAEQSGNTRELKRLLRESNGHEVNAAIDLEQKQTGRNADSWSRLG